MWGITYTSPNSYWFQTGNSSEVFQQDLENGRHSRELLISTWALLPSIKVLTRHHSSTFCSSCLTLRNSKNPFEHKFSLETESVKSRPRALATGSGKCFGFSARNWKHICQLSSSPDEKNQVLGLRSICRLYCHRCGEESSETQGLAAWSSQHWSFLVPVIISRDSSIKTPVLWKLLLTLFCVFLSLLFSVRGQSSMSTKLCWEYL